MSLKSWIAWEGSDIIYGILSRLFWPRNSAGGLVTRENSVLAVDMGDYLMLPSGGLDYGESFREAAIRETLEETGYSIELNDRISEGINSSGGVEILFEGELADEEKIKSEGWGEPVWIPFEEVDQRDWRYNRNVGKLLEKKES